MSHPVEQFRAELDRLDRYPSGVVPVPALVDGTAFFSAGPGLVCTQPPSRAGLPPYPNGGTMIVGHNLDAETPYRQRIAEGLPHGGRDRPMPTWRNLYRLLAAAGVDRVSCFFTNAYVGLKAGDDPEGPFPGARDETFSSWCAGFLALQVTTMRPAVVATIGAPARRFLTRLDPELAIWARSTTDHLTRATIRGVRVSVVGLAHPSRHPLSARSRRYGDATGVGADAALLTAAHQHPRD